MALFQTMTVDLVDADDRIGETTPGDLITIASISRPRAGHADGSDDTILDRTDDDDLSGAGGDDWLSGGTGDDTFVFGRGSGDDGIAGCVADATGDQLDLRSTVIDVHGLTDVLADADQRGDDVVTELGQGNSAELINVDMDALKMGDFIF